MPDYLMAAFTDAKPDRDAEYNAWQERVHMGEVGAVPGVVSTHRYQALPGQGADLGKYLVLYEILADDVGTVLAEFGRRSAQEWSAPSDAGDPSRTKVIVFERRV